MVAAAAFFFAAQGHVQLSTFLAMLVGISLVIGGACVFNNCLDRKIDSHMARTSKRALVSGQIRLGWALAYGLVLETAGLVILTAFTNTTAALAGFVGFIAYVGIYGYFKRRSLHGTEVGSVAGAIPPVVGYTAVTGRVDAAAILLFLILVCWQMPHFYAIAIFRLKDYKAAKLPMLPAVKGVRTAKIYTLSYVIMFATACCALSFMGYAGLSFAVAMLVGSLYWFWVGASHFSELKDTVWGKRMFLVSLKVLVLFSVVLSFDWLLP